MAQQKREYFFATPATASYSRFRQHNLPTEGTMRHLLESCLFFAEDGDTATLTKNGHIRIVSDVNVVARTAALGVSKATQPHQLPLMVTGGDTECDTIDTDEYYNGLTLTPVDDTGTIRMNFKIEFTPTGLTDTTIDAADYIMFMDTGDSGNPKKELVSNLLALAGGYWTKTLTVLEPLTTNDSIDMGTGDLKGGDIELEGSTTRIISVASGAGDRYSLTILGSNTSDSSTGGELRLIGGASIGNQGASTYLFGGDGTSGGDTFLAWTGHSQRGNVGVGGVTNAAYRMKVYDDTLIETNLDVGGILDVTGNATIGGDISGVNLVLTGNATIGTIANSATDLGSWLQEDGGLIKYRTTAEVKTDLDLATDYANVNLSNLSSVAINSDLIPTTYNSIRLGSYTKSFKGLSIYTGGDINWTDGGVVGVNVSLIGTDGLLSLTGGNLSVPGLIINASTAMTSVSTGASEGDNAKAVTKSYVDDIAGGANLALSNLSGVAINTDLLPSAYNLFRLGSLSKSFEGLSLSSGGDIKWSGEIVNGSCTLTWTGGDLELGGADFDLQGNDLVSVGDLKLTAMNDVPASTGAAGTLGEIRFTADYIFVCTATNTWKRTAITAW